METKHTPGPWRRGHFMNLRQYEKMSPKWKQDREHEESKQIFANFSEVDQGRSRIHICTLSDFDTDLNSALIAAAPELLKAAKLIDEQLDLDTPTDWLRARAKLKDAIAKAEQTPGHIRGKE